MDIVARARQLLRPCPLLGQFEHRGDKVIGIFCADWIDCFKCGGTGVDQLPQVLTLIDELAQEEHSC